MKSISSFAIAFAVCLIATTASAQQQTQGGRIAVLDIARVFKKHTQFNDRMAAIKAEVEQYENKVNSERKALMTRKEQQEAYKPDSPEYTQIEQSLARSIAEIQVQNELKRKEMLQKETKIYYETHKQIQELVGQLATQYGIVLILNFDSEQIESADRGSVQRAVSNQIVYQNHLDLTNLVLSKLNPQGTPQ